MSLNLLKFHVFMAVYQKLYTYNAHLQIESAHNVHKKYAGNKVRLDKNVGASTCLKCQIIQNQLM